MYSNVRAGRERGCDIFSLCYILLTLLTNTNIVIIVFFGHIVNFFNGRSEVQYIENENIIFDLAGRIQIIEFD